ncbi:hypothetical protein MBOT_00130 [Mycobacterium botniense]|uniref:CopC domain-containing protein n=1 Tax=Mycobacterium botniense TaxID=84962 RepID=A0A7I9XS95_9MYCO|nr:hypothetical protein MBOT_00130 [Mycobacterium botniense]
MTNMMRMVAVAVLVTALLVSSSALAAAHATRVAADPPENAAVTTSPARVTATFNEELQSGFAAMTVVGPDGNIWSTGQPQVRVPPSASHYAPWARSAPTR